MKATQEVKVDHVCQAVRDCVKERDAYRDLCVELLEDLKSQVAAFAYAMSKKLLADSDELITKAEQLLGEKK